MKNFFVSLGAFLVLDLLWFSFVVKSFNLTMLAEIGRIKNGQLDVLYLPGLVSYVLMAVAVSVFVAPKIAEFDSFVHVAGIGALMGFIIYGIYDFTNLALLKNYQPLFVLVDISWGTFAFAVVSLLIKKINE